MKTLKMGGYDGEREHKLEGKRKKIDERDISRLCALIQEESLRANLGHYQILVSSSKSLLPSKPTQALRKVSSAFLCLDSELTTSVPSNTREFISYESQGVDWRDVPGLTSGALSMYESKLNTG